eukprot:RCo019845
MSSPSVIEQTLGRELSPEERECFAMISPQGVAKINRDMAKGNPLEGTLAELREVFDQAKQRRAEVQGGLPQAAQGLLSRLSRPATTEEMVLLSEKPICELMCVVNQRLNSGEVLEDILADLADAHRHKRLTMDAQRLADAQGLSVSVSRLSPTCAPVKGDLLSPTAATIKATRIRVGLSPLATWFEEHPSEIFDSLERATTSPGTPICGSPAKCSPSIDCSALPKCASLTASDFGTP